MISRYSMLEPYQPHIDYLYRLIDLAYQDYNNEPSLVKRWAIKDIINLLNTMLFMQRLKTLDYKLHNQ